MEVYMERELSDVQNILQSLTWEGKIRPYDAQLLQKLVLIIHNLYQDNGNLQMWVNFLVLLRNTDGFASTSSATTKAFQAIVRSRLWMTKEMRHLFDNALPGQHQQAVMDGWLMSKAFHLLYNLPKTKIYESIVRNYSQRRYRTQLDLIDYMEWCVTPKVVSAYLNDEDNQTNGFLYAWLSVREPLSGLITFTTTMRLMPYNMTITGSIEKSFSLGEIMVGADRYAAYILYPHVFEPVQKPTDPTDLYLAATLVLDGYGTLTQVNEVLPYSAAEQDQWLMADVMRHALNVDRPDVAVYYGLGPDTVQLINFDQMSFDDPVERQPLSRHESWGILDFLQDMPEEVREPVLAVMQLDPNYAASLLQVVHNG